MFFVYFEMKTIQINFVKNIYFFTKIRTFSQLAAATVQQATMWCVGMYFNGGSIREGPNYVLRHAVRVRKKCNEQRCTTISISNTLWLSWRIWEKYEINWLLFYIHSLKLIILKYQQNFHFPVQQSKLIDKQNLSKVQKRFLQNLRHIKGIDRPFGGGVKSRLIRSLLINWRLGNFFIIILNGFHHKISKKPIDAA